MRNTKLILIEGIPGSGKFTLAQFIAHTFTQQGISCQWWYEEEKDHPLYVFHDLVSLQHTIDTLTNGHYCQIVKAALKRWNVFTQEIQSSESVVILDGCLSGYLTWSLFPLQVTFAEDAQGAIRGMKVTGPELLSGIVDRFFVREEAVEEAGKD